MSDIERPKKIKCSYYDYHEVIEFINQKYNIDIDHECEKNENISFWKWMLSNQFFDIENGATRKITLRKHDEFLIAWEQQPKYVCSIMKLIDDEFPEENGEINVIVQW